ncbi:hypothetical protein NY08_2089 [Rhodococcus sp. B7740]|nr:hypothetical protein NY08_2089 [Rhodococcus sp. B7740]
MARITPVCTGAHASAASNPDPDIGGKDHPRRTHRVGSAHFAMQALDSTRC